MTTETKERFKVPSASDVDLYHKSVGGVENTGYTSNHNIEPLTFHPDYAYLSDAPVSLLNRSFIHLFLFKSGNIAQNTKVGRHRQGQHAHTKKRKEKSNIRHNK